MDIIFDSGSKERPRGHALLYFRSSADPEEVWITYMVVLPISVDVSKYVPPFLINQVGELAGTDLQAFAFPPAPERLGSYSILTELAATRDDDILFAGTLNPSDVPSAMMSVNDAVQQYADIYTRVMGVHEQEPEEDTDEDTGLGVSDVLYALMSETDRLGELTKLVGRLRFATEGSDAGLIAEAEAEIQLLAGHLPDNHGITRLIQAVKSSDEHDAELADLYLRRCYHLVQEEYGKLGQLDEQILALESRPQPE
jgi:hypothetical protein